MKIKLIQKVIISNLTIFKGHNKMRIFQERDFRTLILCVTTFKNEEEALEIANDTIYGLGSGVWSRDAHQVHKMSRGIEAGRVWVNCYHMYPSHASFGGYKNRESVEKLI